MSDGFKYQLSSKVGDHMLNIRADSAEEFRAEIDAIFGEGAARETLAPFFVSSALGASNPTPAAPVASVAAPVTATAPAPAPADAPTEKQVAFARQLGIDPTGMTKKSLSAAIDAKVKS